MAMLARWVSPWSRFTELQRESDHLMRDMLASLASFGDTRSLAEAGAQQTSNWVPAIDVVTRGNDLVVRAELSGVDPAKDIDISVHDGMLTIRGERRYEDRQEDDQFVRLERRYGSFERTLALPDTVNADEVKAEYRDGVLQVVIPGAAQVSSARKVPVQIANGGPKAIQAEPGSQAQSPQGS